MRHIAFQTTQSVVHKALDQKTVCESIVYSFSAQPERVNQRCEIPRLVDNDCKHAERCKIVTWLKTVFHYAEFSARSDNFFCLLTLTFP